MALQPAAGARDLNPQQVESNQQLIKKLSDVYRIWGYEEVCPPRIERMETLMAGGAIESKDIVRLVANEPLGLRPEMTVCIARAACTRLSKKPRPLRLWASGTVFLSKESVEGGLTIEESLESGIELLGVKEINAEMELLSILLKSMQKIDLTTSNEPILLFGHTGIMDIILDTLNEEYKETIRGCLLKYDKHNLEAKLTELNLSEVFLEIQSIRGNPIQVIETLEKLYGPKQVLEDLKRIFHLLTPIAEEYGIKLQLDPTYQPHFELYTGIVFQLVCKKNETPLVIARGGRYDNLVRNCGEKSKKAAGLGFSISIDKIQDLKNYRCNNYSDENSTLIVYGPKSNLEKALKAQQLLHENGEKAILELDNCPNEDKAEALRKERNCKFLKWLN